MSFREKLRQQMLKERAEKVSKNASLDHVYKSMMVNALHNKIKANSL